MRRGKPEIHMRAIRIVTVAALIAASASASSSALAQPVLKAPPGITRTDLMRHDLSAPGREVVQVLVAFEPGASFPPHSHPGEELVYVTEGTIEYTLEGRPPVTLKAGDVLFVPSGTIHAAKNVGSGKAAELATYLVEKGKLPLRLAE
jgi:quercetin dioxygenase-like cupin family protein